MTINSLDETYPDGDVQAGSVIDDDLRDIKSELQSTFLVITAPVTATHAELNTADGLKSSVINQVVSTSTNISTLESAPARYACIVSGDGQMQYGPAGWSVSQQATGSYRIDIPNLSINSAVATVYEAYGYDVVQLVYGFLSGGEQPAQTVGVAQLPPLINVTVTSNAVIVQIVDAYSGVPMPFSFVLHVVDMIQ